MKNQSQKVHHHGSDGDRYFWSVKTDAVNGVYRSRHITADGVRKELQKCGHNVASVKPLMS